MRKHKSPIFLKYLLLITISSLIFIRFVKANPTAIMYPVPENPIVRLIYISILFFLGSIVEYFYYKRNFSEIHLIIINKKIALLGTIFKINLVTYPLTQILAYIIFILFISFFWPSVLFIEVLVILIEWKLLKSEFNRIFGVTLTSKDILKDAIFANFYSFLIGLIGFVPYAILSFFVYFFQHL